MARSGSGVRRRAEPADLRVGRHADADEFARGTAPVAVGQRGVVAEALQRLGERCGVVARVVDRARGRLVREGVRRDQVAPPHLDAVEPELRRDRVHHPLDVVGGLRASGSAVGIGRHGVRVHGGHVPGDRGDPVRPRGQELGQGRDHRAHHGREGAQVGDRAAAQRGDDPLRSVRRFHVFDVPAPVGGVHQILNARLRPLHRPAKLARDPRQQTLLGKYKEYTPKASFARFVEKKPEYTHGVFWGMFDYMQGKVDAARAAMKQVIDNGGSLREARDAYFENASTTRVQLIQVTKDLNIQHGLADKAVQDTFDEYGKLPRYDT